MRVGSNVHQRILQDCIKSKDLTTLRISHSALVKDDLDCDPFLGSLLTRLLGSLGSLVETSIAFCRLQVPNAYAWHAIMSAHEVHGEYKRTLELHHTMELEGVFPDKFTLMSVLKACVGIRDIEQGFPFHDQILKMGLDFDVAVGSTLVDMYAKCGFMAEVQKVFDVLENRNIVTWGALIDGCVQQGDSLLAIELFGKMQENAVEPNKVIILCVIKACSRIRDFIQGKYIHDQILQYELELEIGIWNALIDMYAKCGCLDEAKCLFEKLKSPDIVSYGAMMAGYVQHGFNDHAIDLARRMHKSGLCTNKVTVTCILKAHGDMKDPEQGKLSHSQVIKCGFETDVAVGSALIDMYINCSCLNEAQQIFELMPNRNSITWGTMITGYAELGYGFVALEFYERMLKDSIMPNSVTFLGILKACIVAGSLLYGRWAHNHMVGYGIEIDVTTETALVDMYAKCGSIDDAFKCFNLMQKRNIVSWCTMICAYTEQGQGLAALQQFEKMHEEGLESNETALLCALRACECSGSAYHVDLVHEQIVKHGHETDMVIGSAVVDTYAKYGRLMDSRKVFDTLPKKDVISWGVMIAGYAQHYNAHSAIELFEKAQLQGVNLDTTMAPSVLKACATLGDVMLGMLVHHQTVYNGLDVDNFVRNSLVDMYAKCGSIFDAKILFTGLCSHDVASWGAIIGACVQHEKSQAALTMFQKMQDQGVQPNSAIFLTMLKACSNICFSNEGTEIHKEIIRYGLLMDEAISNALIDMYAKCGNLELAHKVFSDINVPGVVSYGTLIIRYVEQGFAVNALHLYGQMRDQGLRESEIILPCILKACTMVGAIRQGMQIHDNIIRDGFKLDPIMGNALLTMYLKAGMLQETEKVLSGLLKQGAVSMSTMMSGCPSLKQCLDEFQCLPEEHTKSMINILGRSGQLKEAENLVHSIPASNSTVWTSLLNACKTYGSKGLGRQCFDQVVVQNPASTI